MRTFLQLLLALLALGIADPQPACALGVAEAGKTCCCTGAPVCQCHPAKPCGEACALQHAQSLDKQLPARGTSAPFIVGARLPSSTSAGITHPVVALADRPRAVTASPPFGGGPPQAMLRLWLL